MKALLLPGMDGGAGLLRPFAAALRERGIDAETFVYPRERVASYEELVPLVVEHLERHRPETIVAESFSGPVAIRLAAKLLAPSLVRVATFAAPPRRFPPALVPERLFRHPPPRAVIRELMLGSDAPLDLVESVHAAIAEVPARVLAARLREVLRVDVLEELRRVRDRAIHLRPSRDRLVPRGLPGVRTRTIEGPHLLLQRHPRTCAAIIAEHLGS